MNVKEKTATSNGLMFMLYLPFIFKNGNESDKSNNKAGRGMQDIIPPKNGVI